MQSLVFFELFRLLKAFPALVTQVDLVDVVASQMATEDLRFVKLRPANAAHVLLSVGGVNLEMLFDMIGTCETAPA